MCQKIHQFDDENGQNRKRRCWCWDTGSVVKKAVGGGKQHKYEQRGGRFNLCATLKLVKGSWSGPRVASKTAVTNSVFIVKRGA